MILRKHIDASKFYNYLFKLSCRKGKMSTCGNHDEAMSSQYSVK